jgi:type II secretory pathway pseudopilin PulG
MTLIELCVGIVVTGIAAAAGYATFSSIIDNRERARESMSAMQHAASTRSMLASWFASARYVRDSIAVPSVSGIGTLEMDDDIRFITTAATPLGSQQTQIWLYIDRDPFTIEEGLVAEFTALNQPIDSTLMVVVSKKMEINSGITGLEVNLLDPTTRLWVPRSDIGRAAPLGLYVALYPAWRDTLPALLRMPFMYSLGNTR